MKIIPIEFARKLDPNVSYDQANAGNEDYVTDDDYFGIVELSLSAEGTEQSFVSIGEDCYGATKRGKGDFTYVIAPSEVYYVNIRFGLGDSDDHLAGLMKSLIAYVCHSDVTASCSLCDYLSEVPRSSWLRITCRRPLQGDRVRIQSVDNFLIICEVEIVGKLID